MGSRASDAAIEAVSKDIHMYRRYRVWYPEPIVATKIFEFLYLGGPKELDDTKWYRFYRLFEREALGFSVAAIGGIGIDKAEAQVLAEEIRDLIQELLPMLAEELGRKYPVRLHRRGEAAQAVA